MELLLGIAVLFISQLINVALNTTKTLITIRGKVLATTLANAITYGFYSLVVIQIASADPTQILVITIVANLIGVPISMLIMNKTQKDKVWEVNVVTKKQDKMESLVKYMSELEIHCFVVKDVLTDTYKVSIYSATQKDSDIIFGYIKRTKMTMISTNASKI